MECMDSEETRDKFHNLILLLRVSQQEYLHFLNVYTKFVRLSVIHEQKQSFDILELLKGGVNKLIQGHDDYLDSILNDMFLSKKVSFFKKFPPFLGDLTLKQGNNMFEIIKNCLDSGLNYAKIVRDLEFEMINSNDEEFLLKIETLEIRLRQNLEKFRKSLLLILSLLDRYSRMGVSMRCKTPFYQYLAVHEPYFEPLFLKKVEHFSDY